MAAEIPRPTLRGMLRDAWWKFRRGFCNAWYFCFGKEITEEQNYQDLWYVQARNMRWWKFPWFMYKLMFYYKHDYGTIVHAMTAAALAVMRIVDKSPMGGISGFQHGGIMWTFVRHWMGWEGPFRYIKFEEMLFPQHYEGFDRTMPVETWEWLMEKAQERIDKAKSDPASRVHPAVFHHWERILDGYVPFGWTVEPMKGIHVFRIDKVEEVT
jgi:hypothetical protein